MKKLVIFALCILVCSLAFARDHFFLIGSPGAGKGTFTQFINSNDEYVHISLGDMLRDEIIKDTEIGRQIKQKIAKGEFIDNAITFALFAERFDAAIKANKKLIIDGMLQSKEHISFFDNLLAKYKLEDNFNYVYLAIPKEIALERLKSRLVCTNCNHVTNLQMINDKICPKCGADIGKRLDDEIATITKRIDRFHTHVVPLIEYYAHRDGFVEYDSAKEYNLRVAEYRQSYLP